MPRKTEAGEHYMTIAIKKHLADGLLAKYPHLSVSSMVNQLAQMVIDGQIVIQPKQQTPPGHASSATTTGQSDHIQGIGYTQ